MKSPTGPRSSVFTASRRRVCRITWITGLVLSMWLKGVAAQQPQVVVYLDEYTPATGILALAFLDGSLVGETRDVPLGVVSGEHSFSQAPPHQVRLIDHATAPARYRGIRFRMSMTYTVDDTTVQVDTITTFLDHELPLDQNAIAPLFLGVRAFGADSLSGRATVDIVALEPRVPPSNSLAFVSNQGSDNITVLDRGAGRIVDVLAAGARPAGMAFSRFSQELFVANTGDHTISVFDIMTRQLVRRIQLSFGDEPTRLALSPDYRYLYVLATGSNSLVMYDPNSNQELGRFSLGLQAIGLAVDPAAGWVYISNELSDNISVFDPVQQTVMTTIPAGSLPTELVFVAPDNLLCAASSGQRVVTILSSTGNVQATAGLCAVARGLVHDPVDGTVYASVPRCSELAVFQPANGFSLGTIPLPGRPGLLTLDADNRTLLGTLPDSNRVVTVNLTGNRVVSVVDVGSQPYMIVVAL